MPGVNPPKVPAGLRDMMRTLAKEVLREKPSDIYEFSAQYFEGFQYDNPQRNDSQQNNSELAESYEMLLINRTPKTVPLSLVNAIIPEQLTELIKDFIKAVLREKPVNIYKFAVEYFRKLQSVKNDKESSTPPPVEYTAFVNYFNKKDRFIYTPLVKCVCGRPLGSSGVLGAGEHMTQVTVSNLVASNVHVQTKSHNKTQSSSVSTTTSNQKHTKEYGDSTPNFKSKNYINAVYVIQRNFRGYMQRKRLSIPKTAVSIPKETDKKYSNYDNIIAAVKVQKFFRNYIKRRKHLAEAKKCASQFEKTSNQMSMAAAVLIIQKAIRQFLIRKRKNQTTLTNATALSVVEKNNTSESKMEGGPIKQDAHRELNNDAAKCGVGGRHNCEQPTDSKIESEIKKVQLQLNEEGNQIENLSGAQLEQENNITVTSTHTTEMESLRAALLSSNNGNGKIKPNKETQETNGSTDHVMSKSESSLEHSPSDNISKSKKHQDISHEENKVVENKCVSEDSDKYLVKTKQFENIHELEAVESKEFSLNVNTSQSFDNDSEPSKFVSKYGANKVKLIISNTSKSIETELKPNLVGSDNLINMPDSQSVKVNRPNSVLKSIEDDFGHFTYESLETSQVLNKPKTNDESKNYSETVGSDKNSSELDSIEDKRPDPSSKESIKIAVDDKSSENPLKFVKHTKDDGSSKNTVESVTVQGKEAELTLKDPVQYAKDNEMSDKMHKSVTVEYNDPDHTSKKSEKLKKNKENLKESEKFSKGEEISDNTLDSADVEESNPTLKKNGRLAKDDESSANTSESITVANKEPDSTSSESEALKFSIDDKPSYNTSKSVPVEGKEPDHTLEEAAKRSKDDQTSDNMTKSVASEKKKPDQTLEEVSKHAKVYKLSENMFESVTVANNEPKPILKEPNKLLKDDEALDNTPKSVAFEEKESYPTLKEAAKLSKDDEASDNTSKSVAPEDKQPDPTLKEAAKLSKDDEASDNIFKSVASEDKEPYPTLVEAANLTKDAESSDNTAESVEVEGKESDSILKKSVMLSIYDESSIHTNESVTVEDKESDQTLKEYGELSKDHVSSENSSKTRDAYEKSAKQSYSNREGPERLSANKTSLKHTHEPENVEVKMSKQLLTDSGELSTEPLGNTFKSENIMKKVSHSTAKILNELSTDNKTSGYKPDSASVEDNTQCDPSLNNSSKLPVDTKSLENMQESKNMKNRLNDPTIENPEKPSGNNNQSKNTPGKVEDKTPSSKVSRKLLTDTNSWENRRESENEDDKQLQLSSDVKPSTNTFKSENVEDQQHSLNECKSVADEQHDTNYKKFVKCSTDSQLQEKTFEQHPNANLKDSSRLLKDAMSSENLLKTGNEEGNHRDLTGENLNLSANVELSTVEKLSDSGNMDGKQPNSTVEDTRKLSTDIATSENTEECEVDNDKECDPSLTNSGKLVKLIDITDNCSDSMIVKDNKFELIDTQSSKKTLQSNVQGNGDWQQVSLNNTSTTSDKHGNQNTSSDEILSAESLSEIQSNLDKIPAAGVSSKISASEITQNVTNSFHKDPKEIASACIDNDKKSIGTQNLNEHSIELGTKKTHINVTTKLHNSGNKDTKLSPSHSSGRLVHVPIAELQLKSFQIPSDAGPWYEILYTSPNEHEETPRDFGKSEKLDSFSNSYKSDTATTKDFHNPTKSDLEVYKEIKKALDSYDDDKLERSPTYLMGEQIVSMERNAIKNSISFFVPFETNRQEKTQKQLEIKKSRLSKKMSTRSQEEVMNLGNKEQILHSTPAYAMQQTGLSKLALDTIAEQNENVSPYEINNNVPKCHTNLISAEIQHAKELSDETLENAIKIIQEKINYVLESSSAEPRYTEDIEDAPPCQSSSNNTVDEIHRSNGKKEHFVEVPLDNMDNVNDNEPKSKLHVAGENEKPNKIKMNIDRSAKSIRENNLKKATGVNGISYDDPKDIDRDNHLNRYQNYPIKNSPKKKISDEQIINIMQSAPTPPCEASKSVEITSETENQIKNKSAAIIQRGYRNYLKFKHHDSNNKTTEVDRKNRSATVIQRANKKCLLKKSKLSDDIRAKHLSAIVIQKYFRQILQQRKKVSKNIEEVKKESIKSIKDNGMNMSKNSESQAKTNVSYLASANANDHTPVASHTLLQGTETEVDPSIDSYSQNLAATIIQKTFKKYLTNKKFSKPKVKDVGYSINDQFCTENELKKSNLSSLNINYLAAALIIQKTFRSYIKRKAESEKKTTIHNGFANSSDERHPNKRILEKNYQNDYSANFRILAAALKIQKAFRSYMKRKAETEKELLAFNDNDNSIDSSQTGDMITVRPADSMESINDVAETNEILRYSQSLNDLQTLNTDQTSNSKEKPEWYVGNEPIVTKKSIHHGSVENCSTNSSPVHRYCKVDSAVRLLNTHKQIGNNNLNGQDTRSPSPNIAKNEELSKLTDLAGSDPADKSNTSGDRHDNNDRTVDVHRFNSENEIAENVKSRFSKPNVATISDFIANEQKYWEQQNVTEITEEPCIKKIVSRTNSTGEVNPPTSNVCEEGEIDPLAQQTDENATLTDRSINESEYVAVNMMSDQCRDTDNDTETSDDAETLDKASIKLSKTDGVIEKMSQRRLSETRQITPLNEKPGKEGSFEEPIIRPMSALEDLGGSLDLEENDIVVFNSMQGDDTRESSANSDAVIFGNARNYRYDENASVKSAPLRRLHTIAGENPKTISKSVIIGDAVEYINSPKDELTRSNAEGSYDLDDDISANIRQKMMAYSLSEADSDYFEAYKNDERGLNISDQVKAVGDDFNVVHTAIAEMAGTSTDTESTIVSAATKIQAGARGFLTRRRLRRASASRSTQENKASFGNAAISESLDRLVENEAAKKIQQTYRKHYRNKKVNNTTLGDEDAIASETSLAARRMTLQRGDALRNDSTADEEGNGENQNNSKKTDSCKATEDSQPLKTSKQSKYKLSHLRLRQNSMPVQIDCEVFRVIPKHMRKRIKSAEGGSQHKGKKI